MGGEKPGLRPNGYLGISSHIYLLSSPWWAVYEQYRNSVFHVTELLGNCICWVSGKSVYWLSETSTEFMLKTKDEGSCGQALLYETLFIACH